MGVRLRSCLSWIALAAMLGVLSLAGDATAASPREDACACCPVRKLARCCCEPTTAPTRSGAVERSRTIAPGDDARPCECRPDAPASPASRQEPRAPQTRVDRGDGSVNPPCPAVASTTFDDRPGGPTAVPPKTPLYLRIAHLRI
jgi:hypothetical protein